MGNKVDEVRQLLINGASTPRIVVAIMKRCQKKFGTDRRFGRDWMRAAIAQTAEVLDLPMVHARALVSEYAPVTLSCNWKKILDNQDI